MNVLLVVGGGIAAYKACYLAREFGRRGHTVRTVMTPGATRFVAPLSFEALTGQPVYHSLWETKDGPMEHIDLARWADVAVVAPATADLLARITHGLGGDLATTMLLAYTGELWVAPAMNPAMWANPATEANLETLRARGVHFVGPGAGDTACGEIGAGRMSEPEVIAAAVLGGAAPAGDLTGVRFLITTGPTREHLDPARFLSNPSTGRMGFEVARAAQARGAAVTVVAGPTSLKVPEGIELVSVVSTAEMAAAVEERWADSQVFVGAAAVADWTPKEPSDTKQAKVQGPMTIELVRTRDILAWTAEHRRPGQLIAGFAAETGDVIARGRGKLARKAVDVIVANRIGEAGTGFAATTTEAAVLQAGQPDPSGLEARPKEAWAAALVDTLAHMLLSRSRSS